MSTHKCRKTYYAEARDGNIHSFEVDALIAPVKQDLIGGRADTNALKFQVILDEDPNICGICQRISGKLCGVEQSIPFISDDRRLFRIKTLHMSHHSFVNQTVLDLWHRRLGHVANESIIQTVNHSTGMNNISKTVPRGINCPDCMIASGRMHHHCGRIKQRVPSNKSTGI